jgi:hypothetical protein
MDLIQRAGPARKGDSTAAPRIGFRASTRPAWVHWDDLIDIRLRLVPIRRTATVVAGSGRRRGVISLVRHAQSFLFLILPRHSRQIVNLFLFPNIDQSARFFLSLLSSQK